MATLGSGRAAPPTSGAATSALITAILLCLPPSGCVTVAVDAGKRPGEAGETHAGEKDHPSAPGKEPALPPARNRLRRGHVPTPHSAEEIRRACPTGHFRRFLVEIPGQDSLFRKLTFTDSTKDIVEMTSLQVDAKGRPFGETRRVRTSWKAFQAEASFPKAITTVRNATVTTLAGVFPSWLYEIRRQGGREIERYWFGRRMPGPPVQYERHLDGQVVFRMALINHGMSRQAEDPARAEPRTTPGDTEPDPERPATPPGRGAPAGNETDPDDPSPAGNETDPDPDDPSPTRDETDPDPDDPEPEPR